MLEYSSLTRTNKTYINAVGFEPYTLGDICYNRTARLNGNGGSVEKGTSLNIDLEDLKFLIVNNLISVQGIVVTSAGKMAMYIREPNPLDINTLQSFKQQLQAEKQEIQTQRQKEQELKELEQKRKEKKFGIVSGVKDFMDFFTPSTPSSTPSSSSTTSSSRTQSRKVGLLEREPTPKGAGFFETLQHDMTINSPNLGARNFHRGMRNIFGDGKK